MSLFTSLFSPKASELPSGKKELVYVMGNANFDIELIGADNFQAELELIGGPHRPQGVNCFETATLRLEDPEAVRVEIQGKKVGYLSQKAASFVRQQLALRNMPKGVGQCAAVIRGGWLSPDGSKGPYRVWMDFPI
jgi:hypothetical protein